MQDRTKSNFKRNPLRGCGSEDMELEFRCKANDKSIADPLEIGSQDGTPRRVLEDPPMSESDVGRKTEADGLQP